MTRFLFGRPGSGKTYATVESIRHLTSEGQRVFLIVPEQQAYTTERDLLEALPPEAGQYFSVLSFTRLADRLFELYGGRAHSTVTRAMRSLLMWENLRQLEGILETYRGGGAADPSLCRKMLSAVDELTVCGTTPASLEGAAKRLPADSPLGAKLRDIALVSAAYTGLMTEVYGEDPADRLLRAAAKLEEHPFFAGAYVFLDSFTSFTVQEYAVLRHILLQANGVTVTLGCQNRADNDPHMQGIRETAHRLSKLCKELSLEYEDLSLEGNHRTDSPELIRLEQGLWCFELAREELLPIPEEQQGRVRLTVCPTRYDEAEAAALHILEAKEQGIPYGEIAVITRDLSGWEGILDAALEQYDIPFFLSKRMDLSRMPAARLLLTALRCIAWGYRSEDVLTLCKTGLLPVTLREIDAFAEYVDTWSISGKRMTEDTWSMNPDGYRVGMTSRGREILVAANKVRTCVMTPLLSLEAKLKGAADVTEQCRALYEYFCDLDLRNTLTDQAETHLSLGHIREAGELLRLWSFLTETLATVATVMREAEPLSPGELCTALTLVFADTDIGSVPPRHDCVTLGDAATLRVENVRVLLAVGLCEGEFPRSVSDDGLLTEQDKETLSTLGIELDGRADRLTSDELMYVWRSFSKPSDRLLLSYSSSTVDGQSRSPSAAVARVRFLLPHLKTVAFSSELIAGAQSERYRTPTEDTVSRPVIRKLLGREIWLSQSRLQTFSRCPYSYYSSHILSLRERAEARFDNLNAGNFLHHVMEQYLKRALDGDNRIRPMDRQETQAIADAIIDAYMIELCGDVRDKGRLLRFFDRLRRVALMLMDSIQQELANSMFTVAAMEWDTHGYREGDPRPMTLRLEPDADPEEDALTDGCLPIPSEGKVSSPTDPQEEDSAVELLLGGRIDRVDIFRSVDGETVYVRVVDYKSSRHDFTVKSITKDMNIQLLLYLFTLCSPRNRSLFAAADGHLPTRVVPASMVYISPDEADRKGALLPCRTGVTLDDPAVLRAVETVEDPETTMLPSMSRNKKGQLTGKGLYSAEQMAELETLLRSAILETASLMYRGCASRTPSPEACRYCPVRSSCGVNEES